MQPVVGFIGLGDQGLPMAIAIAEAGFALHAWDQRPEALDLLGDVPHVRDDDVGHLAAACDVVGLCVSTDEDVMQVVSGGLLRGLRPGSVVINHGTGTPCNAVRLTETCAGAGVDVLDAPVSGGRPAAAARTLTTMVGGPEAVARRCAPVLEAFSRHVVHLGGPGSGQAAKLFNNALLGMNQAAVAEIVELAVSYGMNPGRLIEVLKLSSASSAALTLLNTMITLDTVDHLAAVQALDVELFRTAMAERGVDTESATARGLAGAEALRPLLWRLDDRPVSS